MTVGHDSADDVPVHERLYQAARVRQAALTLQEADFSASPGVHPRRPTRQQAAAAAAAPPAVVLMGQRADAPAPRHLSLGRMTPPGESIYDTELTSASRRVETMQQPADDGVAEALRDAEALLDATRGVEERLPSDAAPVAEWTSPAQITDADQIEPQRAIDAGDMHAEDEEEEEEEIPLPTEPLPDAGEAAGGLYLL
jgi:hypothetical protein